jgi:serine/threonine protein kinase
MVECQHSGEDPFVEQVQIIDLENAAYLPKGRCIKGMLAGNENWRSPEAHFKGELSKPTDMFSFGIVVSPLNILQRSLLTSWFSVYTRYSNVLSLDLTRISENTKSKVHCLLLSVYNAKFRILETLMGLMVS